MSARGEAIVLVGFMGTGKSSVGRELARRTGLPRHDTDAIVTNRFGLPVAEIFARHGEQRFRDSESEALGGLPAQPAVIVTGGGTLLRGDHVALVRRLGTVVQLTADLDTLFERLSRRATRPLLRTPDPRATIEQLLRDREPLYRSAADFTVDTSRLTHQQVADAVLAGLERAPINGSHD